MKTRKRNTTEEAKLILWGLDLKEKRARKEAIATSAEPINNFFDYADTTLSSLSNLVTGVMPILHVTVDFLVNALNSIPWVSVVLNILNGIFRAVRSLVMKQVDHNKRDNLGPIGTYGQRIWLTATGIAAVAMGLASMFIATLAIPFTIASTAVDTFNRLVKFSKAVLYHFTEPKEQTQAEKSESRTRVLYKLESLFVSATSLVGTVLLFTPLMPLGAGLLISSAIYTLADKYNLNPFKRIFSAIKNKMSPSKGEEKTTVTQASVAEDTPEAKEERSHLFEKLYCKPKATVAPQKQERVNTVAVQKRIHGSRGNPMTLFQESKIHADLPIRYQEEKSLRLR